jgi:hypothetical protein
VGHDVVFGSRLVTPYFISIAAGSGDVWTLDTTVGLWVYGQYYRTCQMLRGRHDTSRPLRRARCTYYETPSASKPRIMLRKVRHSREVHQTYSGRSSRSRHPWRLVSGLRTRSWRTSSSEQERRWAVHACGARADFVRPCISFVAITRVEGDDLTIPSVIHHSRTICGASSCGEKILVIALIGYTVASSADGVEYADEARESSNHPVGMNFSGSKKSHSLA